MANKFLEEIQLPEQGAPTPPVSGMSLYVNGGKLYGMLPNGSTIGPLGASVAQPPPSNMVTLDTPQTITASKTFSVAPGVPDASFGIAKVNGLQVALDDKYSPSNPQPAPATMVTTNTNQSISGTKTFTASPLVPDSSWSIAKTTGLQAALDAKYSASNPQPAPTNMVTTDSIQTIGASKTFLNNVAMNPPADATATTTTFNGVSTNYGSARWTGTGSLVENIYVRAMRRSAAAGDHHLEVGGELRATGGLWDSGNRVYSAANPAPTLAHTHTAANISDSTTVGRSVLTAADAAAARTAIGAGTSSFSGAYSALTGTPTTFATTAALIGDATATGRSVLTAADAAAARTAIGAGTSNFSGAYSALTGIPATFAPSAHAHGVGDLTATGTRDATTFLRGDGTWAAIAAGAPANMVTTDTAQTISGVKTFTAHALYTGLTTEPATPAAGTATLFTVSDQNGITRFKIKSSDGQVSAIRSIEPYIMSVTGALTVRPGASRIYLEDNYVVESIRASVNTAPAGASVIVDVNLNGTSIFTNQANRPTIIAGANTAAATMGAGTNTAISTGQYITVDVDQIGTTTAGADLSVVIRLRRV